MSLFGGTRVPTTRERNENERYRNNLIDRSRRRNGDTAREHFHCDSLRIIGGNERSEIRAAHRVRQQCLLNP